MDTERPITERQYQTIVRYDDPIVRDHRVFEVRILPGVCLLDLVCRIALRQGLELSEIELRNILFIEPVVTQQHFDRRLRISFRDTGTKSEVTVESMAEAKGQALEAAWVMHARCELLRAGSAPPAALSEPERQAAAYDDVLPASRMYEVARTSGIVHGEFYQPLGELLWKPGKVLARFQLNDTSRAHADDFLLHPAYLDGSTLVPFFLNREETERLAGSPYIPFHIESFRIWQRAPETCYTAVSLSADSAVPRSSPSAELLCRDISLYDGEGHPVAAIRKCSVKRIREASAIQKLLEPGRGQVVRTAPVVQTAPNGDIGRYLKRLIAESLGRPEAEIPERTGFYDLGLDSSGVVRLAQTIERQTGKEIYPTLLFEYPSIETLTNHLTLRFGTLSPGRPDHKVEEGNADDGPAECRPSLRIYDWTAAPAPALGGPGPDAPLLMLASGVQRAALLATSAFADRSRLIFWVEPGLRFSATGERQYQMNPARRADFDNLLAIVGAPTQLHIVHLWNHGQTGASLPDSLVTGFESVVSLEQAILALRPLPRVKLFYFADPDGPPQETAMAAHFRTVALEAPSLEGRVVEAGGDATAVAEAIVSEVSMNDSRGLFEVRYEGRRRFRRTSRLLPADRHAARDLEIRPGSVYWITGGAGGLGLSFARGFAKAGARVLVTGRSAPALVRERLQVELGVLADAVTYRQVDAADAEQVRDCVREAEESLGPIRGVIHSAGVTNDGLLVGKDLAAIAKVLAPKLAGTLHLDEATRFLALDFFILFSSISATVGNPGQSDYAYANGFLDRFAGHRERLRDAGLRYGRTVSLAWPPWADGGMKISAEKRREIRERHGMEVLSTEAGLQVLDSVLALPDARGQVVVWNGKAQDEATAVETPAVGTPMLPPAPHVARNTGDETEAIAIIGLSGRFPKAATLAEFWRNLAAGRDCITEVPAGRWRTGSGARTASTKQWGGFLDDFDCFDPLFFQISPRDARLIDPQERLFLEIAWAAIEDAGYSRDRLRALQAEGAGVGVFAGVMWNQYQLFRQPTGMLPTSWSFSVANRVSHYFDLHGPSVTLDTACSSSLLAVHMACESIRRGESSLALAGGVNLSLHPDKYQLLEQMRMLSPAGRCQSFGAGADGYVAGEGVGAVLLCPLTQALKNGDAIYGVIRGSAVNHCGRTSGYTVPHPGYQARAIGEAIRRAGVNARQITHIEAHGTGTALGDPIEIAALTEAFSQHTAEKAFCSLSSVKSNIGHLEAAAGIAALTKVLLEMKNETLVPSLHSAEVNSEIRFESTPFYLQRETAPWKAEGERIAGISSFGAGGVNVHLIVAEPPARPLRRVQGNGVTEEVVLSAHSQEALRRQAAQMAEHLTGSEVSLADLAFTLQRREWMEHRIRFTATSIPETKARLEQIARGESLPLWAGTPSELHQSAGVQVSGLPTYPFERQRYWMTDSSPASAPVAVARTFTSQDEMLRDHRVQSQMVVPAGAYLAMLFEAAGDPAEQQWGRVAFLERLVVSDEPIEVAAGSLDGQDKAYEVRSGNGSRLCRAEWLGNTPPASVARINHPSGFARELDAFAIDRLFSRRGIEYGPSCRLLASIGVKEDIAVGTIKAAGGEDWAIVDAALQVTAALLVPGDQLFLPYSIERLWLGGKLETVRQIHVRRIDQSARHARFDLQATDSQGETVLRMEDLCLKFAGAGPATTNSAVSRTDPSIPHDTSNDPLRYFQPVWRRILIEQPTGSEPDASRGVTAILSAGDEVPACVRQAASILGASTISDGLSGQKPAAVWYLAATNDDAALALFGLVATLREAVPAPGPLEVRILTQQAWGVSNKETPCPGAASVAAMARTVAAENPHWRVSCIDVDSNWLRTGDAQTLARAFATAIPKEPGQLRDLALRLDGFYERRLQRVELEPRPLIRRDGGVYVIVGGAGGIGAALARHFAAQAPVRLALLGRRPIDGTIHALLRELELAGSEALYLAGDITNSGETARLFDEVRSRFGPVHGVVHSAAVLRDGSLAGMSEADFRAALEVKTIGSVSINRATRQDPLDFLAFFSSLNSFAGNRGQANYVAGCGFQDAYAARLLKERPSLRIFVCNWGYWGETGVVASPGYEARMKRQGIGSISTVEGLAAFERILGSDLPQVLAFKANEETCRRLGCLQDREPVAGTGIEAFHQGFAALELLAGQGLARVALDLGETETATGYGRQRAAVLASAKDASVEDDKTALRRRALAAPGTAAWLRLLDTCLEGCAAVMTGSVKPAEVLFPGGSLELVNAVYQGNPAADHFNALLAEAIKRRLPERPDEIVRVLEVGAGTGATTNAILDRLGKTVPGLEYWFTDLSPTLVRAASNRLGAAYSYLRFSALDIESGQSSGLSASYDIVTATNVLHATRDLRRSLRNIHGLLKPGGRLILNELTAGSAVLTATFGLTEGWWSFEDEAERLPHSPLVASTRWKMLLEECGFSQVEVTESEPGRPYRQALLEAVRLAPPLVLQQLAGQWEGRVRHLVARCLELSVAKIDDERPFAEYGLDSISAVDLIREINRSFSLTLSTTILFDFPNVRSLARHLSEQHGPAERAATVVAEAEAQSNDREFPSAVLLKGPGSIADLRLYRRRVASPAAGEVQIAVAACSLNFGDLLCIKGLYPTMPAYPFTPGFEVSGRLIAVGQEVKGFQPGDEVVAILGEAMGGLAEVVNTDARLTVQKPKNAPHETAAAFPVAWLTAHCALERATLKKGERILIQTAAGGTGLHAVRMALALGAEIFATAGSPRKLDYLKALGVHHVIAYREADFRDEVLRLTDGRGVDVVLNTLSGDAIRKGIEVLAPGGRYVELAMTAWKSVPALDLSRLVDNQAILSLDLRRVLLRDPGQTREYLDRMAAALERGSGDGMVDRVFPLDQLRDAFQYLEGRESIGKVVISMPRGASEPAAEQTPQEAIPTGCVAIVGMSARLPGARDVEQFWINLRAGVSSSGEVPAERWDAEAISREAGDQDYRRYCRFGAFLDDIHSWDPLFFRTTGTEARYMSPEQRLFLEEAWNAIEDAGISDRELNGAACGVYAAAGHGDYAEWLEKSGVGPDGHLLTGNHSAILGARLSYLLNLKGPSITVDTACSSSLVAIELACRALRSGQCDTAVAGGAFLMNTPRFHLLCGKAGMLSPSGKLSAFSADADGFVPGEGVAVVVLKRLEDAMRDNDRIHGIIRGIGVNQDGQSNGITAPSSLSQSALEQEVYASSSVAPETISMLEAHGTGTALGDPIEVEALARAFRATTPRTDFCAIGSVKTNIGHTVYAAGVAAVIKVLLCFRHRELPPSLNCERANPGIPFESTAFTVNRELRPWQAPAAAPLRAAVSSFGFSGTNCHLVLEEPPATPVASSVANFEPGPELFLVSAKSKDALRKRLADLAGFLAVHPEVSLRQLASTLATRRSHFAYRFAVVADSVDSLRQLLVAAEMGASGEAGIGADIGAAEKRAPLAAGDLAEKVANADGPQRNRLLLELAALYEASTVVDWELLYPKATARPLSLPAYPFQRVRCSPERSAAIERTPQISSEGLVPTVRALLASAMAIPGERIGLLDPWESFGLDSLLIKRLNAQLAARFGPLPATLFFERRNLKELANFLENEHPSPLALPVREGIAIIGLAGRYPGARNIDEFWQLLAAGGDAIREVPAERWDHQRIYDADRTNPAGSYTRWGGFLEEVDRFDPLFFGISPKEAECMDPQERIFLEVCWHALEDAAYTPSGLSEGRTDMGASAGVFAGVTWGSYQILAAEEWARGQVVIPGPSHWSVANRVSHVLNWSGPSLTVDTACSSSLVALHLACEAILRGECGLALAGGVNLYLHPSKYVGLSQQQFASSDGRCRSFGSGGDGYVPGEGAGAVVLKPLSQAIADGDRIYGVIRGSATTHGGRTHGFTVPNPAAQAAAIERALEQSGFGSRSVSYVEAHGTGTELGDPVEIAALSRAFGDRRGAGEPCAIGSVKSNIGHLESAAGIAGLTKVLLQMKHRKLAPSLHAETPNPAICFERTSFRLQRHLSDWMPVNGVRRAGLSSFGAGGANAHILLEEFAADAVALLPKAPRPELIPIAATNEDQLRLHAAALADRIEAEPEIAISSVAATLQRGREALACRLAIVANSGAGLARSLRGWLAGSPDLSTFSGRVPGSQVQAPPALLHQTSAETQQLLHDGELPQVARRWADGAHVKWESTGAILSLPGYPFVRERYWLPEGHPMRTLPQPAPASVSVPAGMLLARPIWRELADRPSQGGSSAGSGSLVLSGLGDSSEAWAAKLRQLLPELRVSSGWPPDQPEAPGTLRIWHFSKSAHVSGMVELLALCKAILPRPGRSVELVSIANSAMAAMQAASLRTLVREHPGIAAASLAIDEAVFSPASLLPLCLRMPALQTGKARELSVRDGLFRERSCEEIAGSAVPDAVPGTGFRSEGVYLISGGAGGIGRHLARHLAAKFHARLALLGRGRFGTESVRLIREIGELGGQAIYLSADVTDAAQVEEAVRRSRLRFGTIHGVIHAAGLLEDCSIAHKDEDSLRRVLAPKLDGAIHLDRATSSDELDFFALFSSLAAVVGNPGQFDYAAANAFLDDFARRRMGRTLSVNWPLWKDGGMQIPAEMLPEVYSQTGMAPMPAREGLDLLEQALVEGWRTVVAAWGDTAHLRESLGITRPTTPASAGPIEALVRELCGKELKVAPERIDPEAGLDVYGIDSVSIRRLTAQLEQRFGTLPKTIFFHHRTVRQLSAYLAGLSPLPAAASNAVAEVTAPPNAFRESDAIAIVGISGRFPGADSPAELWELLRNGREAIREVPPERWDHAQYYDQRPGNPSKTYARWGGFLDGVDQFDPLFFGITPKDAESMDPQERLFLETAWLALEDAGYCGELPAPGSGGRLRRAGVFAGVTWGSYQLFGAEQWGRGKAVFPNSSFWSIANRVSYTLDLHGPSMPVDTACSASLSAIHLACESLRRAECALAIAGGVNLYLHPSKFVQMAQLRFASTDGKCRSFGDGGDGYVPGEGVGVVVLKPLSAAIADRDHIYGLVLGGAINHGGKTNGYTVPNPDAQAEVVRLAIERAGIAPHTITCIEAHGTGTQLGDPIEMDGLRAAFEAAPVSTHDSLRGVCALGSIKSNIGHLESAAGVAGLFKVLLQMRHRTLAPTLHAKTPNPAIDFSSGPFRLQKTCADWESDGPRRAGISSFGAGGSNAHLIVQEYAAPDLPGNPPGPVLIVLSARNDRLLLAAARNLRDHFIREPETRLVDAAFTLQNGRRPFAHRLALIANSVGDARSLLEVFLEGGQSSGLRAGVASLSPEKTEPVASDDLHRVAAHWVSGGAVRWEEMPGSAEARRISLPGSPFEKRRCWFTVPDTAPDTGSCLPDSEIVVEESILRDDPIAAEHLVNGVPTLPGAALLEIASRAMREAGFGVPGSFEDVCWLRRAAIHSDSLALQVSLTPEADGVRFEVQSSDGTLATGRCAAGVVEDSQEIPAFLKDLDGRGGEVITHDRFYETFERAGIAYGPLFRGVASVRRLPSGLSARFDFSEVASARSAGQSVVLDAAFQTVQAELRRDGQRPALWLPWSVESVRTFGSLPFAGTILVRRSGPDAVDSEGKDLPVARFHVAILNHDGRMAAEARNFCVKSVKAQPSPVDDGLEQRLKSVLEGLAQGDYAIEEADRLLNDISVLAMGV